MLHRESIDTSGTRATRMGHSSLCVSVALVVAVSARLHTLALLSSQQPRSSSAFPFDGLGQARESERRGAENPFKALTRPTEPSRRSLTRARVDECSREKERERLPRSFALAR